MKWNVTLTQQAKKQLVKLPEKVVLLAQLLVNDLTNNGVYPGRQWPNYGKLTNNKHHCHLKKGRPTYVSCWELMDKPRRQIEVYYVGTHENVPY